MAKLPTYEEMAKEVAEKALDEYIYKGKTLREWVDILRQTRWIPVSERLPKKTGRYLCTVGAEYRNPREMYYAPQEWANKSDDATWRSIDGSYVYDWFVKAWMPLPEPYKETEE